MDKTKKVNNPLFSVSVTGGTFEDFTQHAMILPAKEKPPPPTLNLTSEQILSNIVPNSSSSSFVNQQKSAFDSAETQDIPLASNIFGSGLQEVAPGPFDPLPSISEPLPVISSLQPHLSTPAQQASHFSSVISSFSNILNIGGSGHIQKEEVSVGAPAGIEHLIGQENSNLVPVPLFAPSAHVPAQVRPPTNTGPSNVFRRSGLKRPTYAPVPGLSNTAPPLHQNAPQNVPHLPQNLPPQPQLVPPFPDQANYFVPLNTSVSPANSISSSSSVEQFTHSIPNHFKPISPPPPSLPSVHPIPQPLPTVPSHAVHFGQPLQVGEITKSFQSPVMDAMPASELLQDSNLNDVPHAVDSGGTSNDNVNQANLIVNQLYRPVYHHWFYQKETEGRKTWYPFSMVDSLALDHAFTSNDLDPEKVIATDGGRYDVNILRRQRSPVYWKGNPTEVRRCSWFYKGGTTGQLVPYEENVAARLEQEFKQAFESGQWNRKVELADGKIVVFHGPDVFVLFSPSTTPTPDAWANSSNQSRPRVVKRGMDEFDIDEGEPAQVDHILFMVHGIGSVCDFKLRTVEEVVDEFRNIAFQLVQSHYKQSCLTGKVNRVEVLPISWHEKLHSEETGIDKQLKGITLESIPKLRDFTNDTLLDILFYTSPIYCQNIMATVGNELNRVHELFKQRNPSFSGGISLGGHSLGSLILFDLLCHQAPKSEEEEEDDEEQETGDAHDDIFPPKQVVSKPTPIKRKMSRRISYMMGTKGTGQPQIHYPHLNFEPKTFFALGSPIGMFVIIRGLDTLGEKFQLPTCPSFLNIFHPYDPIAYRIESLIHPDIGKLKPVLIPHHKGRKRMHLELKETMARVGADLKQKVVDSMKSTWNSFYQLAFYKTDQNTLEEEVDKVFNEQMQSTQEENDEPLQEEVNCPLGSLNNGRRVDYVLQEAPFEFINEYIFALTSHVCYWDSEDTILLMLKEIYSSMGVTSDSQIPQQSMTIERPPSSPTAIRTAKLNAIFHKEEPIAVDPTRPMQPNAVDPTRPMQPNANLRPPPTAGFVRKT